MAVGTLNWPVSANGFIVSLTHDVAGPFTQPLVASVLLGLLAVGLVGWLAVVSTLRRAAFVAGMVPVIFLLLSLNLDALGVFEASERYFLYLTLGVLGGTAFGLHSFGEAVRLGWRYLIFSVLVAALMGFLLLKSELPPPETVLQTAAFFTPAGAVLFVLLVLWVGIENVRALLWFNTQSAVPSGRFRAGAVSGGYAAVPGHTVLAGVERGADALARPHPRPAAAAAARHRSGGPGSGYPRPGLRRLAALPPRPGRAVSRCW